MVNKIKNKLINGEVSIGSWMQIPNNSIAEIMGKAEYDWVAVDLEHGAFSLEILPGIFQALELGGTAPLARVAQNHPKDIKQALDAGCKGLIIPMVETVDDIVNALSWAKFPPTGTRGVGFSRANLFGKNFREYVSNINNEIILIAQIEHIRGVDNLEKILSIKGVDAIIVGPYDLSASMNLTGKFDHPDFIKVLDRINNIAKAKKIPMGLHIVHPDKELLNQKIAEGYQFIAYGIDAVFLYKNATCPIH